MDYGFGAVFGCPAHDQRDLDFALKYKLKITPVVKPINYKDDFKIKDKAYTDEGIIFNSDFLNDLKVPNESIIKTIDILERKKLGKKKINFRKLNWKHFFRKFLWIVIFIVYYRNWTTPISLS